MMLHNDDGNNFDISKSQFCFDYANAKESREAVNPELRSGSEEEADDSNNDNRGDESESKCAEQREKMAYNGQQLLLLQHII